MTSAPTLPAHARLSPSSASAWMTCFGYPNANEGLPDETSEFAAEGTFAHTISDACLTLGFDAFDFIGHKGRADGFSFEWDDDDADLLQPGIDWVRTLGGEFFGEHKVELSNWLGPDQFGTLDRGIVLPDLIIISDLKWGRGIPVSPVRNKQLMLYALGFWWNVARHISEAKDFLIHIDQPRCAGGGGEWRVTLDELLAFGEEAKLAAERTRDPDAPRIASADACLWCRRKSAPGGCPTFDEFNLDLAGLKMEDLDDAAPPQPVRLLTPARRSYVLQHRKMFESWLDDLHAECLNDALAGRPTDGLKAVEGRRNPAKWGDKEAAEVAVVGLLGEREAFSRRLISPTQVTKKVTSEVFEESVKPHVQYGEKKPVLVPEGDAREAITTAESKMDDDDDPLG